MDRDRRAAYLILKDVQDNDSWSNLALSKQFSKETPVNPAFVRELVYGIIRNQLLLDWNIDRFLKKSGLKSSERILLRMGFYQLAFMDIAEHAAVSETVALAKLLIKGKEGFINAVLRSFQRSEKKLLLPANADNITMYSVKYSAHPSLVKLLMESYGENTAEEILRESCREAPLTIRVNTLKCSREALSEQLTSLGFVCKESELCDSCISVKGGKLLDTKLYTDGLFSVQGEASQYAVQILNPLPGETMLDVCAAPGGKSCAAAERMKNTGCIKAYDFHEHRVALIKKEASRLGISIIEAKLADSAKEEFPEADCVLCDVPCSGLGTLRRNPELKLKEPKIPEQAFKILCNTQRFAKDRLLYTTCTVNPEENELAIKRFMEIYPEWQIEFERQFFPSQGGPDGFYISLLRKVK